MKISPTLLIIVLIVAACSTATIPATTSSIDPNTTPSYDSSSTQIATRFLEGSATPTATQTHVFPFFAELPAGDYVLYYDDGLIAISPDGSVSLRYTDLEGVPISSDSSLIMSGSEIYNTRTRTVFDAGSNSSFKGCTIYSSSADQTDYVAMCFPGRDLYVLSATEDTKILIGLRASSDDRFEDPNWSPNGRWISYFRTIPDPNYGSSMGITQLFLVDTSCLVNPSTCAQSTRGPINGDFFVGIYPYSWSPDSRYIAIPSSSATSILIYDTQTGSIRTIPWETGVYSVAWSPDGNWLAISGFLSEDQRSVQIYLIPVAGGESRQLTIDDGDKTLIYWISVP